MGNFFGKLFKIMTWGESHGLAVGVVIDGCPAGLELSEADIQGELDRRRPGQSDVTTSRDEADRVEILSGVFGGKTLGSPISLLVRNKDVKSDDYLKHAGVFRPSHADYTYYCKYGTDPLPGGGRASARETVGRVAAGAVAKKLLKSMLGVSIRGCVEQVADIVYPWKNDDAMWPQELIESSVMRCPDLDISSQMEAAVLEAKDQGDSLGGVIACRLAGVPASLGSPVFRKMEACLAQAMLSIPASKGFEIGSGFAGSRMLGSEHNDAFIARNNRVTTKTNFSGGVQGGISNGQEISFKVAFKPTATISKEQDSVDMDGRPVKMEAKGRHDPCVLPRAVPIVEAMAALVLVDAWLEQSAYGAESLCNVKQPL